MQSREGPYREKLFNFFLPSTMSESLFFHLNVFAALMASRADPLLIQAELESSSALEFERPPLQYLSWKTINFPNYLGVQIWSAHSEEKGLEIFHLISTAKYKVLSFILVLHDFGRLRFWIPRLLNHLTWVITSSYKGLRQTISR